MTDSKLPLNRIVAFAGPYIAVVSGALADWLIVHVHLLGLFHTSKTAVTGVITQATVFGLTSLLVWLGHQKWLSGWQSWERTIAGSVFNGPEVAPHPIEAADPYDPTTASTVPPETT